MSNIPLKTKRQVQMIVKNIVDACGDITKLRKFGYDYIYLASGFIAHYNLHGFIDHYSTSDLRGTILANRIANQFGNFSPGDQHYDYYMQKAEIYNAICEKLDAIPAPQFRYDKAKHVSENMHRKFAAINRELTGGDPDPKWIAYNAEQLKFDCEWLENHFGGGDG